MIGRINWIDYAKVIGIWLVVLGHMYNSEPTNPIRTYLYGFHMPLFFILSGMLHKESKTVFSNIKKYFKSLIIPFIVFQILFIIYYGTVNYFLDSGNSTILKTVNLFTKIHIKLNPDSLTTSYLSQILKLFGGIIKHGSTPNGVTWFLLVLFYVKIMMDIFLKSKYKIILLIVNLLLLYFGNKLLNPIYINSALMAFPLYCLGYFIFNKIKNINIQKGIAFSGCFILLLISYTITYYNGKVSMFASEWGTNFFLFYLNGILGSAAIIIISFVFNQRNSKTITEISLSTLVNVCIHYPIVQITFTILNRYNIYGFYRYVIFFLVTTLIVYFSVYVYKFLMRYFPWSLGKF